MAVTVRANARAPAEPRIARADQWAICSRLASSFTPEASVSEAGRFAGLRQ
jgi:hypothetical protein